MPPRSGWCRTRSTGSSTISSGSGRVSRSPASDPRTARGSHHMIAQGQSITHDPRLLSWDGAEGRPEGPGSQVRAVGHVLTPRWRLIAAFVVAGVAGMAVVTLLTERRYTATAVIHVENDTPHVTKIDQVVAAPSYLESVEYFQD